MDDPGPIVAGGQPERVTRGWIAGFEDDDGATPVPWGTTRRASDTPARTSLGPPKKPAGPRGAAGSEGVGPTARCWSGLAWLRGDEEVHRLGGSSVLGRTFVEREPKSVAGRF